MLEQETLPVNKYLPPRPKNQMDGTDILAPYLEPVADEPDGFFKWLDKTLDGI